MKIEITSPHFRPKTRTEVKDQLFMFNQGGMGDYICWLVAIKWIAKEYNFLRGHLIVAGWFAPIAHNILKEFPNWKVYSDEIPTQFRDGYPIKVPRIAGVNATMMNLVDLGFIYFAGINPVPKGQHEYPQLDLSNQKMPSRVAELIVSKKPYAVLTPGATDENRKMTADAFNRTVDHLISLGITPVFLGTTSMDNGTRNIIFDEKYDLTKGIDLTNMTTLMQAAKIISKAQFILGIDNGLLHLAAMTSTTILFGYTIAGPETRRPYRPSGDLIELYPEKLACKFCQERVRFFIDHNFKNCIYLDNKCVKELNAESWIGSIDLALRMMNESSKPL